VVAVGHERLQRPPAQHDAGLGELSPVVDALRLELVGAGAGHGAAAGEHQGEQVGQVVLALAVVRLDLAEQVEGLAVEHVHAGVDLGDGQLPW
jgi:hypothetical protein